jgi:membrane protease YdiL (CAAX protease family)
MNPTAPAGRRPPPGKPAFGAALIVALALLPFALKAAALCWFSSNYLAQSAYKLLQLAVPVGWRRRIDGARGWRSLWPIDEPLPSVTTWLTAIVLALATIALAAVLIPWVAGRAGIDPHELRRHFDAQYAMTPWRAAAVVAFLATFNAGLEELHFRAWLDRELSARWGSLAGIAFSAAAFAAMHTFIFAGFGGPLRMILPSVFVALAVMGAAWSWLARFPGGIHAAWLAHGLTDAGFLTWGLFWLGYFSG